MTIYTIENENNNITVHASLKQAEAIVDSERFRNEAGLGKLAAAWPAGRLVAIWNSLPGVAPVRKFKDRATAVNRIWNAIQHLGDSRPVVAANCDEALSSLSESSLPDSPVPAHAGDVRVESVQAAHEASLAETPHVKGRGAKSGSKTETILSLMKQPGGTTLKAMMQATDWQAHSVRGFISGTLGKKMGFTVVSSKGESGERTYSISV